MDFLAILELIYQIFDKGKTLKELITPEIEKFAIEFGNAHLAAAREHLSNVKDDDPVGSRSAIELAIGDLEDAYQIYMLALPKGWRFRLPPDMPFSAFKTAVTCYSCGCAVSLLQSRCRKDLGDLDLARKYAERAKECFDKYEEYSSTIRESQFASYSPDAGPMVLIAFMERRDKEYKRLSQEKDEFQKNFNYLINTRPSKDELGGSILPMKSILPDLPASPHTPIPSVVHPDTPYVLPCGHELHTPTAHFCGVCGAPIIPS